MASLNDFLASVQLPTMPQVAHELIHSLNDEDVPLARIRDAVCQDPTLALKLMRLANSARYGLQRQVGTVDEAIAIVGANQVRTLVLASCLSDNFPTLPGLDQNAFWAESQMCGGYAQWLAQHMGSDSDQAWLTGFMVRLGELIVGQAAPQFLPDIERLPSYPGARWQREMAALGFTEGQVIAELARRWNFPEAIVRALETAADPLAAKPFSRLGAILYMAELLAESGTTVSQELIDELPPELLMALQVDSNWLAAHLPEAQAHAGHSLIH
ncbi:HDOD domain-containing protein [Hydrogenophaga sp. 5NK40-0174]|uniref:HDOD domain-containing protein n=1 Tax=Hydrogenophaga sp. 5NK40-0174 TaxID=3127649 RepID=UPI003108D420